MSCVKKKEKEINALCMNFVISIIIVFVPCT